MKSAPYGIAEFLAYDPVSGNLTWIKSPNRKWSGRVGDIAGAKNSYGYIRVGFRGTGYLAHRIAWFLTYGTWPETIDHRDGNPANNALANLREATIAQNSLNKKKVATSIAKGVVRSGARFQAQISRAGKHYYLGIFDTVEQASAAYEAKAAELFGEFARAPQ